LHFLHHWKLQLLKKTLLLLILFFLFTSNFPAPLSAAQVSKADENPKGAVLCYHHIVPESLSKSVDTVVSLSEFEGQMKYLYEHGYYTASLKDVEEFLYNKKKLPENTVVITFDDGYESNYLYAYPILKKHDLKALIFIIGSKIVNDGQAQNPHTIAKLSFDQIKEMTDSGLVEFGNHTFNAHDFKNGKPCLLSMSKDRIFLDFEQVNEVFADIGLPKPKSIAYPYGKFNDVSITAAETNGYKLGFTVSKGYIYQDSHPMTLNRIIVPSGTTTEKFKTLLQDDSPALPEGFEKSVILRPGSDTAYLMGKPLLLKSAPIIVNGVAMAPLDFFTEQLGWDVIWDPILYQVATRVAYESKAWFTLTAYIVDRKVMVPVRALAEAMGYEVKWHQEQKMVELKKP
jgi:peptidoglycan/xylan/chitin deacetylase (PgdA/CDA1 family)